MFLCRINKCGLNIIYAVYPYTEFSNHGETVATPNICTPTSVQNSEVERKNKKKKKGRKRRERERERKIGNEKEGRGN